MGPDSTASCAGVVLLVALALPAGCKARQGPADAEAGEEVVDADLAETSDAEHEPHCCPLDSPSCECTYTGGTPDTLGRCESVCGTLPEGWVLMTDLEGCLYWHVPEDAGPCTEEPEETPEQMEPWPEAEPEPVEPGPDADTD
jgi:hypothetical protein